MGRLVVYFKRNNEARRRHWFGEDDDSGGFKHIGSNTFSNRRVRHSLEFRREFRLETQTWKNQNLLTTSDQLFLCSCSFSSDSPTCWFLPFLPSLTQFSLEQDTGVVLTSPDVAVCLDRTFSALSTARQSLP